MKGGLVTLLMVGGALAAGGAAAYFANEYVERSVAQRRAELESQYEPVRVVVANQDLRPGALLSAQTVAVREIPRAFLHSEAVRADEWGGLAGRVLASALRSGEPVLMSHLAQDLAAGFSAQLPDGMRALTLPVDQESSISGMLAPGDRIDLLFTMTSGNEPVTAPLLLDVPVLATGVRTIANDKRFAQRDLSGDYRTVTVAVTPQNAAKITLAQDAGKVTVILRQPHDDAPTEIRRVTRRSLLDAQRPSTSAAPRRPVEIILGRT